MVSQLSKLSAIALNRHDGGNGVVIILGGRAIFGVGGWNRECVVRCDSRDDVVDDEARILVRLTAFA